MRADGGADLRTAVLLAPDAWRASLRLSKYHAEREEWSEALVVAERGYFIHPDNYYLGLQLAGCYMYNGQYEEGIQLLKGLHVLPNEGASEGRNVWRETHLHAAIAALGRGEDELALTYISAARTWPENIGVGRPYDVDERLEDYLEWIGVTRLGRGEADVLEDRIVSFRGAHPDWPAGSGDLLSLIMLRDAKEMSASRAEWLASGNGRLQIRWCNAFLDGDRETVDRLSGEKVPPITAMPYEIPYEDRAFPLIKKMYQTGLLTIK